MTAGMRYEVFFSGHVQGVGFRWATANVAANFSVVGFVRNLSDGRVQLVVEGSTGELDRFLGEVRSELGRKIDKESTNRSIATGEYRQFSIES